MKVTVLNDRKQNKNSSSLISSIFMLCLGIILTFNSDGLISSIFTFLGVIVIIYGISRFCRYFQLKNQLHVEQSEILLSAVTTTFVGLIVVFLSNFIANTIQIVTGIWLMYFGISKLSTAIAFKSFQKVSYVKGLIVSFVIMALGLYTIFAENVVFVFIGIVLILYSVSDIVSYFIRNK